MIENPIQSNPIQSNPIQFSILLVRQEAYVLSTYIQFNLAWIMPRCPRCHNIGLFVTHEVFNEDEKSAWTEVRIGSDAGKHAARRLYTASEGGRLSGLFLTSTITRVSSLLQSPFPWVWQPATDYPSKLKSRLFSISIRCAKRQSQPDRQTEEK